MRGFGRMVRACAAVAVASALAVPAGAGGAEAPVASPGIDPATGQSTLSMSAWAALAAQAMLERSSILVVGATGDRRTELVDGHVHTLTPMTVAGVLKGSAPPVLTVRVEGGVLPDGTWEDTQSLGLPVGRTVVVPLHPVDRPVGLTPTADGTYRIDQKLLGLLFGMGALQPDEAITVDGRIIGLPPCGTCTDPGAAVSAVNAALADLSAATGDALYDVLSAAGGAEVTACGDLRSSTLDGDAATLVGAGCDATGGDGTGDYTLNGQEWFSRYLPARYRVWNNTPDVVGEERGIQDGAAAWTGTWFSTEYKGLATGDGVSTVKWTSADIDALARAATLSRGEQGFIMYFGDQYCWALGAKKNCYDIASVARHEWGHVLGLGHSTKNENIMKPGNVYTGTTKGLGPGDRAGLRYLYPWDDYRGVATETEPADRQMRVFRGRASEDVTVAFQNVGRTPWYRFRPVHVVTDKPLGRCSMFDGSGSRSGVPLLGQDFLPWPTCSRPVVRLQHAKGYPTIEPGETGTATFRFNAPYDAVGTFTESFVLDLDGPLHVLGAGVTFTVTVEDLLDPFDRALFTTKGTR